MKIEKDYEEFIELLNKHKVKYCIIGSYALAYHARPRYTKDIDFLIEISPENAKKIISALNEFGFASLKLTEQDFLEKGNIIQLGYEPVRHGQFGDQKTFIIDRKNLIKSKQISNRTQDAADIELLSDKSI